MERLENKQKIKNSFYNLGNGHKIDHFALYEATNCSGLFWKLKLQHVTIIISRFSRRMGVKSTFY